MREKPDAPSGWAVVAGGSGGLGVEICHALSRAGFSGVIGFHSNADKAGSVAAEIAAAGGQAHARRAGRGGRAGVGGACAELRDTLGPISAPVYAAGPSCDFDFVGRVPMSEWRRVLETDVLGC